MADLDSKPGVKKLALNMETERSISDTLGNVMQAWFVPPATGKYKFYTTCDDACTLDISEQDMKTDTLTNLITMTQPTPYRSYFEYGAESSDPGPDDKVQF